MHIDDIQTPALVLDLPRLRRNAARMAQRALDAGVRLRPHMKTAKAAQVAKLATQGHFGGITVSTLAEAEYFANHGTTDITYAVCMVPAKLARAAAIQQSGATKVTLRLLTDSLEIAENLATEASVLGQSFSVLIEIDSGEHRTGIPWDAAELIAIAQVIDDASHLVLDGVLTHAGHSYGCTSIAEVAAVADQERRSVVGAAARLREAGLPCSTVSAGSTPTAVHAASFEGLTEIRPGVYMFFDLAQLGRGSCAEHDIAISVLSTVIGHQRRHDRILIDAGGLALSKDTSAGSHLADTGLGWIVDHVSMDRIGDLHVALADQEHGFVEGEQIPWDRLPIGTRIRVLPNHACMTVAAYDHYVVVDAHQVIAIWDRANGWGPPPIP